MLVVLRNIMTPMAYFDGYLSERNSGYLEEREKRMWNSGTVLAGMNLFAASF